MADGNIVDCSMISSTLRQRSVVSAIGLMSLLFIINVSVSSTNYYNDNGGGICYFDSYILVLYYCMIAVNVIVI